MSTRYPTPVQTEGKWLVDLRAWGLGRRIPLGPDTLSEVEAVNLAWVKLNELRAARAAEPGAQLELSPRGARPELFTQLLDQWASRQRRGTKAGKHGRAKVVKQVRAGLGAYELSELDGPEGDDRLRDYLTSIEGLAPVTIRWRFSVIFSALRFAAERGWMRRPAVIPREDLPAKRPPKFEYIDEPTFRAVRDATFVRSPALAAEARRRGETLDVYVARRRAGLSLLFYLGLHTRDVFGDPEDERNDEGFVAGFTDGELSLDFGVYTRVNSKSAAHVPVEQFELPEPLIDDLRALLRVLGREAFHPGERIAGGYWPHAAAVMNRAAKRLAVPGHINPRLLRKSYAREMFKRGYTIKEVSDRMGHADTRMLQEVYARTPRPMGSAKTRWLRPAPGTQPAHSGARVVTFPLPIRSQSETTKGV